MNTFFVNDVFTKDNVLCRILFVCNLKERVYYIELEVKNPLPRWFHKSEFERLSKQKSLSTAEAPGDNRPVDPSPKDQAVGDARWTRLKDIVLANRTELLEEESRTPVLKRHAALVGTTTKTLLADLRRWWTGGQTQDALRGSFHRCGMVEAEQVGALSVVKKSKHGNSLVIFAPATSKARGRKGEGGMPPFAISAQVRAEIIRIASAFYEQDSTRSVRAATDKVLTTMFAVHGLDGQVIRNEDGKGVLLRPYGQKPTVDQVRRMLRKVLSDSTSFGKRYSKAELANNHAASTGSVKDDAVGPGDVYEIDATYVDLFVVAAADRKTVIGKPTLYLVIDRFTRLIVGFLLSLENPSWNEAKQAVLSITADWEALCLRLGVTYRASDWPAQGVLPNRFVGDRGEMISYASDVLCDAVRIPVTNPPALASQRKCVVECSFKTTQVPLKDNVPGYEPPSNVQQRRGKKYDKDATHTLDEIAAIFLRIVITHNSKYMAGYAVTPEEVYNKWLPTPLTLWKRGIESQMGTPSRYPYALLRMRLMPRDVGHVHVNGIAFKGLFYELKESFFKDWCTTASLRGAFDVVVAFNPSLVTQVLVFDPKDKSKVHIGVLTSDAEALSGYSFAEAYAFQKKKKLQKHVGGELNTSLRIGLAMDIADVVKPAVKERKEVTRGVLLGSRHRGAVDVRQDEARARRKRANSISGDGSHGVSAVEYSYEQSKSEPTNVGSVNSVPRTADVPTSSVDIEDAVVLTETRMPLPASTSHYDPLEDLLSAIGEL